MGPGRACVAGALALVLAAVGCGASGLPLLPREPEGYSLVGLPPAPPGGYSADSPYRLLPGDKISVVVKNEADLNADYLVPPNGEVELWKSETAEGQPRQRIPVVGKTVAELRDIIAEAYHKARLRDLPYVQLELVSAAPRVVYVRGAVRSASGVLELPRTGPRLTLYRAIQAVGGEGDEGDLSRVRITRKDPATGADISLPTYDLDLMGEEAAFDRDPPVEANDIITIPVLGRVWISGHVNQTGDFPCKRNMTFSKLVAAAGGLKQFAKVRDIRVIRGQGLANEKFYRIDYQDIIDGESYDPLMAPGDRVQVPEDWK